uniref:PH domain-containing protein n=1 Tax=Gadus morhua TaxID=8049 RepID=A0A8C5AN28_GADMO
IMSSKDGTCRKFQANIFNKSKCQNCFKPRESHLLNDEDLNQAKPTYGGWLLLAPEGTNFDNPLHRSRKWQRRFFVLYEHGLLRYALDEMPSTLPQGTINMNQCSDVVDGEGRTGQKNSLAILTPERDHFVRAECKEIINGWQEALTIYPRTNKHNLKKKRKVEPPTPQEPGPAKVAVTSVGNSGGLCWGPGGGGSSIAGAERVPATRASLWQDEAPARWSRAPASIPYSRSSSCISQLDQPQDRSGAPATQDGEPAGGGRVLSGMSLRARYNVSTGMLLTLLSNMADLDGDSFPRYMVQAGRSRGHILLWSGVFWGGGVERRRNTIKMNPALQETDLLSRFFWQPDLLNFKKGWMTKLYDDGMWKKHWFVLTDQSLRYYKDSIAEEVPVITLSYQYCIQLKSFVILSKEGACTLSAMTSGIRRNWIQAILKNVRPATAPDVTRSLPEEQAKTQLAQCLQSPADPLAGPEGSGAEVPAQPAGAPVPSPEPRKSRVRERRREGRSKTYDWSEFRTGQTTDPLDLSSVLPSSSTSSSYASSTASSPGSSTSSPQTSSSVSAPPPRISAATSLDGVAEERARRSDQGRVAGGPDHQGVIEEHWHQVETTPLREEKQVPIATATTIGAERRPPRELATLLNKELGEKQQELDRLQEQNLHLKEQLDEARGREHSAREGYVLQATCERGFAAMEETHQKVVEDLQRQHQREVSKLLEERERLLAEETAATIFAIEAMKNAHKEDLEKTQRPALSGLNSDIDQLHSQYEAELQSVHRELEVLSEQYSQKCLENAHLAQALEAERNALRQCQRENQELNSHNQELNNRLTDEIMKIRSCFSGQTDLSPLTHGKDLYELEVLLRIKESEIQYLKQEIHSLKDELQSALRDKKYSSDKYKDIYTELSIVKAKADCDIGKLKEKLLVATEALGERKVDGTVAPGYDIMKSKSTPDFLKKERMPLTKQLRGVRSKSITEQVSWDS